MELKKIIILFSFIGAFVLYGCSGNVSDKNRDMFEGVITYKHYYVKKHPWKKDRDSVYSWFYPKTILYVGKKGSLNFQDKVITFFSKNDNKQYSINTYKNKTHCFEDTHPYRFSDPISCSTADSTRIILGRRCNIVTCTQQWGKRRELSYFYVDPKIKVDTAYSPKQNRNMDALLGSYFLLSRHEFRNDAWAFQEAVEIKEMNTDQIFAKYQKIVDNDQWISFHRRSEMKRKWQRIALVAFLIIVLAVPMLYIRKVKFGISAYFISLAVLVMVIAYFWMRKEEKIAEAAALHKTKWFRGFNEGIEFFFASCAMIVLFLIFTIAWTLIMKYTKKNNIESPDN